MKTIYLLLVLPFCLAAQHNFSADSNKLSWELVYNTKINPDVYFNSIKTKKDFIDCNFDGVLLYGTTPFINLIDSSFSMPIFARYDVKFIYKIEFKENRYRVLITNLIWYSEGFNENTNFEDLLLKNRDGSIRSAKKYVEYLDLLDIELTKIFTYKAEKDW
jgi:archaellin